MEGQRRDGTPTLNDQTNRQPGEVIKPGSPDQYAWFYNVSTTPYSDKDKGDMPRAGYDGAVFIALGEVEIDFLEPVSNGALNERKATRQIRASMVFHELAESYFRTHGNGMSRDEAHNKAIAWEGESFGNPKPGNFTRFIFK